MSSLANGEEIAAHVNPLKNDLVHSVVWSVDCDVYGRGQFVQLLNQTEMFLCSVNIL